MTTTGRLLQRFSGVVAALSALALVALQMAATPSADAAGTGASPMTVRWAGDAGPAAAYQPVRDPKSPYASEFADLTVTVSKTRDLTDEAVRVTVDGMPGATRELNLGSGTKDVGANFLQAMQCWGDPTDPDFWKNCQFGAAGYVASTPQQAATFTQIGAAGSPLTRGTLEVDVPFRAASGSEYSSLPLGVPNGAAPPATPVVSELFSPSTTNEQLVLVGDDRRASFGFETQSAASAPHLNCGGRTTGGSNRCWLVVVPRGEIAGPDRENCPALPPETQNMAVAQLNSPVNPACDYWGNRVVVPLDFQPVASSCAAGSQEVRLVGSELTSAAVSSWQRQLCTAANAAYTLNTVADALARDQLIAGGSPLVLTNRPLGPSTLDEDQQALLSQTDVVYAPTTVSAVSVAFVATKNRRVYADVRLNARLLAKQLTQSYTAFGGGAFYRELGLPGWGGGPLYMSRDPEFLRLNPGLPANLDTGQLIVTGPGGSDAIEQVWAYIRADSDARAFLSGQPDPDGMTLNPYYLPAGHQNAEVPVVAEVELNGEKRLDPTGAMRKVGLRHGDGSPRCLCDTSIDVIPKADETSMPRVVQPSQNQTVRYDSLQAWPYAESYHQAATMVFRSDNGSRTQWDGGYSAPGVVGRYVGNGLSQPWNSFLGGLIDTPTAAHYELSTAALQLPRVKPTDPVSTVFVRPDDGGMTAAVAAAVPTPVAGVAVVDPARLTGAAYPLTLITYAGVNLTASTPEQRASYVTFLQHATGEGQTRGSGPGQLPAGYLPLSDAQRAVAAAVTQTIASYVPPVETPEAPDEESYADSDPDVDTDPAADPAEALEAGAAPETLMAATDVLEAEDTESVANPAAIVLGGTLLLGLAGAAGSPVLMRRKDLS